MKRRERPLSLAGWLKTLAPESLFYPLVQNEILWIALSALLLGIAARRAFEDDSATDFPFRPAPRLKNLEQLLHWILALMPRGVSRHRGFGV